MNAYVTYLNKLNEMYICTIILIITCSFSYARVTEKTTLPANIHNVLKSTNGTRVKHLLNNTRRILKGYETDNRPFMVYLKLPVTNAKYQDYRNWLCGGVIIHEEYILTSAACIEDAKHFYIVSGTFSHSVQDDKFTNNCIKNGAKKAVWKCVPKNYIFDGHENDNIRWMSNDIAVVKTEDEFDFTRRIRGCDFIPKPVPYNNHSANLEEAGTIAYVAGWGSTKRYNDPAPEQKLLEAKVGIISKQLCKYKWGKRYHNIIDNYMICSRDLTLSPSETCKEKYVECSDIMFSEEDTNRRKVLNPENLELHSEYHNDTRRFVSGGGGFCENDHGGPLINGKGVESVVIGIISACLVKERSNNCYGPFLYTSIYKNRNLINCAINKDLVTDCSKVFRSSETHVEEHMSWIDHPDGPAKNEDVSSRRAQKSKSVLKVNQMKPSDVTTPNQVEQLLDIRILNETIASNISTQNQITNGTV